MRDHVGNPTSTATLVPSSDSSGILDRPPAVAVRIEVDHEVGDLDGLVVLAEPQAVALVDDVPAM
jgi:hypothetical protein